MTKQKIPTGVKYTILTFLAIIGLMAIIFNFEIKLAYSHDGSKTNIVLWPWKQIIELSAYKWWNLDASNKWVEVLTFFIIEAPYILLLLFIFGYMFAFARGFSTDKELSEWIQSKNGPLGRLMGVLFGLVSPFCSCSTIPIVTSMIKSRIPFGTLVAFLITSPMINEIGIALMISLFGYKIALIYISFGIIIGIVGSYAATWLKLEDQIKIEVEKFEETNTKVFKRKVTLKYLHKKAIKDSGKNIKQFWWILLLAILAGAFMHGFVPQSWIENNIGNKWWAPLALVPIGMGLYLNVSATLPIAHELVQKGLGIGPSLGFMMGVNTLSIPEIMILTKLFKKKFMFFFVGYLLIAILSFAYIIMFLPDAMLVV